MTVCLYLLHVLCFLVSLSTCLEYNPYDQEENLYNVKSRIFQQLQDQMNKISFPGPEDTEAFVRSKIQQYYYLRSGKRKLQWMFKPYKGTTPHIREIFLGRCWDYVQNKHSYLLSSKSIDCVVLWNSFVKAFANKNPCGLRKGDYSEFFSMIYEKPLFDKVLLWSGTREWAHTYARLFDKYVTLEDTFAGFLLNGLTWCGSKNWPGINFKSCPYECSKQKAFWGLAADKVRK